MRSKAVASARCRQLRFGCTLDNLQFNRGLGQRVVKLHGPAAKTQKTKTKITQEEVEVNHQSEYLEE
jgi:hypothetical protein